VVECGMEYDVMMGLGGRGGWATKDDPSSFKDYYMIFNF